MGQYKVPQDVEAEDTIIGPYTLKQFIYAVIGVAYILLMFQIFKRVLFIFVIVGLPPGLIMLILGLYKREGQPFEAYFLAMVNYWFNPRRRIWVKEDVSEVFKIEQPLPKPEEALRDPREVRGQLEKLAQIVDTRGWNIKEPEVQEPNQRPVIDLSDRLTTDEITLSTPAEQPEVDLADDMLDLDNNPSARNLGLLIQNSEKSIHEEIMQKIRKQLPSTTAQPGAVTSPQPVPVSSFESKYADVTPTNSTTPPATTPAQTTDVANSNISEMTTNPIADILKRAMETPDLKLSQVSQIAAQTQPGTLVEGQDTPIRTDQPQP